MQHPTEVRSGVDINLYYFCTWPYVSFSQYPFDRRPGAPQRRSVRAAKKRTWTVLLGITLKDMTGSVSTCPISSLHNFLSFYWM